MQATTAFEDGGEYELADETYAQLLDKLAGRNFKSVSATLSADILRFYASSSSDPYPKKDRKRAERKHKKSWIS